MTIEAVTPSRDIGSDRLWLVDEFYIRTRCELKTAEADVKAASEPGTVETVRYKIQCSQAKDESGDVVEDAAGAHTLFGAEVHSVSLDAIADGMSLDAWLAERVEEIASKAARKARVLEVLRATG